MQDTVRKGYIMAAMDIAIMVVSGLCRVLSHTHSMIINKYLLVKRLLVCVAWTACEQEHASQHAPPACATSMRHQCASQHAPPVCITTHHSQYVAAGPTSQIPCQIPASDEWPPHLLLQPCVCQGAGSMGACVCVLGGRGCVCWGEHGCVCRTWERQS